MTFDEALAVLDRITYKPGHRIELAESGLRPSEYFFRIVAMLPDARDESHPVRHFQNMQALPIGLLASLDQQGFVVYIQHVLREFELHERDEWLRLDGEMVEDPHASDETAGRPPDPPSAPAALGRSGDEDADHCPRGGGPSS